MLKIALALCALLTTSATHAGTIYLCRAYNGATFWAQQHCSKHNALIERIDSVADVPWDQQVQQAEQAKAGRRTVDQQQPGISVMGRGMSPECSALDTEVKRIDAQARQPQSAPSQAYLAERRKEVRDRQFRVGCQ